MPNTVKATSYDVRAFHRHGALKVDSKDAEEMVEAGTLELVSSSFSDPGEDYTKLVNKGQLIGYWPGY